MIKYQKPGQNSNKCLPSHHTKTVCRILLRSCPKPMKPISYTPLCLQAPFLKFWAMKNFIMYTHCIVLHNKYYFTYIYSIHNKDRMVHIYAAQYFLVTSYWRCPTDRVWSKFLSLIHCKVYNDNCLLNNFAVFKLRLKWLTLHKRGHYHRNNCCKQTLYSWLNPPFQNLRFILSGRW